jgi:FtsZ-binding cell division protein ZapB
MKFFIFLTFILILCYCTEEEKGEKKQTDKEKEYKSALEDLKEKTEEVYEEARDWWETIKWLKDKLYKNKKD